MNLEQWVEYSGYLPIINSASIIIAVSVIFGYIIENAFQSFSNGFIVGLACGISGFLLVILPNLVFIRRMMKDEQQNFTGVKQ